MPKPKIYHTVSLGTLCLTAQFFQDIGMKPCSYPYDWIFSNIDIVIDTLSNDFESFLDPNLYTSIEHPCCGHTKYGRIFNHHDPMKSMEDYAYLQRCVARLYGLFQYPEKKLLMMVNVNQTPMPLEKIELLNDILQKLTRNFEFLFVQHAIKEKESDQPWIETLYEKDNLKVAVLTTQSEPDGVYFKEDSDNNLLKDFVLELYDFVQPTTEGEESLTMKRN